jgi:hypothetical protein
MASCTSGESDTLYFALYKAAVKGYPHTLIYIKARDKRSRDMVVEFMSDNGEIVNYFVGLVGEDSHLPLEYFLVEGLYGLDFIKFVMSKSMTTSKIHFVNKYNHRAIEAATIFDIPNSEPEEEVVVDNDDQAVPDVPPNSQVLE